MEKEATKTLRLKEDEDLKSGEFEREESEEEGS